jgi:hypothetical protein
MAAVRTLGDQQAYQDGKRAGRAETLLALARAFEKVLTPDSIASLSTALLDGLERKAALLRPSSGADAPDPTEPGSAVYSTNGCVFRYCPHPDACRARVTGCTMLVRLDDVER